MILTIGNLQIDLTSPKTAFALVCILFLLMTVSAYCAQQEKKFVRTRSGRLTTKRPTKKVRAKKQATKSSSLVPTKLQKQLVRKKKDKTVSVSVTKGRNTSTSAKSSKLSKISKFSENYDIDTMSNMESEMEYY
jgi:hypothetical protein